MFKVNNYKRMLAYSSVEHLGIIVLGIGIGGLAFVGAMYHIAYNSLNKLVLFFTAGNIHRVFKTREIKDVSSVLKILPWTGWLFMLSFFAISAIPPFGIFFSELMIFQGILFSDRPWLLAITMFMLLFIFINMGKTIFNMLYGGKENEAITNENESFEVIHFATIVLLILLITIAVISPDILHENILNISKDFGFSL